MLSCNYQTGVYRILMQISYIKIENFRALRAVELHHLPPLAVFVGKNGVGKSTLFQVFGFLQDALNNNVTIALQRMGGYKEVATRENTDSPIRITIQFRMNIISRSRLVTYELEIIEERGRAIVAHEVLQYKRGSYGSPFHFLHFNRGEGYAISNEEDFSKPDSELHREYQQIGSPDILAIKGLGQFQRFKAAAAFRNLIERWHVSDFHITAARQRAEVGVAAHLSESGDNLPIVAQYLYQHDKEAFNKILQKFRKRIPGMADVTVEETRDGHVLLCFQDGSYKDPFIARYVSDGTIKMFAYLVLLHDPSPHPFLCVEEPENQLYMTLMEFLAEDLRDYAKRGGQVFVSTHSPDFLNHIELNEAFLIRKHAGNAQIVRLSEDKQTRACIEAGDKLGYMWQHDMLENDDALGG